MEAFTNNTSDKDMTKRVLISLDDSDMELLKKISNDTSLPLAAVARLFVKKGIDLYKKGEIKL